jgi:hypothetical protein
MFWDHRCSHKCDESHFLMKLGEYFSKKILHSSSLILCLLSATEVFTFFSCVLGYQSFRTSFTVLNYWYTIKNRFWISIVALYGSSTYSCTCSKVVRHSRVYNSTQEQNGDMHGSRRNLSISIVKFIFYRFLIEN